MPNTPLRSRLIRLAQADRNLRPHLLRVLSADWNPGLHTDQGWEQGHVEEHDDDHAGEGSQAPPARDENGKLLPMKEAASWSTVRSPTINDLARASGVKWVRTYADGEAWVVSGYRGIGSGGAPGDWILSFTRESGGSPRRQPRPLTDKELLAKFFTTSHRKKGPFTQDRLRVMGSSRQAKSPGVTQIEIQPMKEDNVEHVRVSIYEAKGKLHKDIRLGGLASYLSKDLLMPRRAAEQIAGMLGNRARVRVERRGEKWGKVKVIR